MILMYMSKVKGDCQIKDFSDHFTLTSCSFGVERELADSAKAGTADITFGVGTLTDLSIGKTMDSGSTGLARFGMRGATVGTVDIKFVQTSSDDQTDVQYLIFLWIKLDNAFVKTWNISGSEDGRPEEELTLWYNKIYFQWYTSSDGKTLNPSSEAFSWNHVKNMLWTKADGLNEPDKSKVQFKANK